MKIVLFGPERRIGAWRSDKVIDLNRALASYLREQRGDSNSQMHADERIPHSWRVLSLWAKPRSKTLSAPSSMLQRSERMASSTMLRA